MDALTVLSVVFYKRPFLYFWVYTSPVLRVDAPAVCSSKTHYSILSVYKSCVMGGRSCRGFLFSLKHRLIFLSVYKSCVTGGRSRGGFLFSSKNTFLCSWVLCYGWTLPQGLFVFFRTAGLYLWVYTSPVLRVGAPAGAFCFLQKRNLIFSECIQVLCCGWAVPQGLFVSFKNAI